MRRTLSKISQGAVAAGTTECL